MWIHSAQKISVAELRRDAYVGKTVQVTGKVTEVCEMAGCWMNLTDDGGRLLRAWSEGELALGVTCDPPAASDAGWLHAALADELACVAAWLDRNAPRVRLLRCDGVLVSALPALPAPSSRRYIS